MPGTVLTSGSGRRWLPPGRGWLPITTLMTGALIFRIFNVMMVNTYFVPDEFWQGPEVAHRMVYGQGHLTWEWDQRLRGALHPGIIAAVTKAMSALDMGSVDAMHYACKITALGSATLGDYATLMLTSRLFGAEVGMQALLCQLTSWCYFYTMSRTLSNSMEAALTALALSHWPWPGCAVHAPHTSARRAVWIAALSFMVRPTGCVVFAPIAARRLAELWRAGRRKAAWRFVGHIFAAGCTAVAFSAVIDRLFYGEWTIPALNFVRFNLFGGGASIYGVHPWHWYWSQGLPGIVFTAAPLVVVGVVACGRFDLLLLAAWTAAVYSMLPHKEFRFILPLQHLAFAYAGAGLAALGGIQIHTQRKHGGKKEAKHEEEDPPPLIRSSSSGAAALQWTKGWLESLVDPDQRGSRIGRVRPWLRRWGWRASVAMLAATNLPIALYLSSVHQKGSVTVMRVLDAETRGRAGQGVLFLMPCHSTPFHSHVGQGVSLSFLDCSPEGYRPPYSHDAKCASRGGGASLQKGLDEADRFFKDPGAFLDCAFPRGLFARRHTHGPKMPTLIVAFDGLEPKIRPFLEKHKFRPVWKVFHTHFALESRISENIVVYRRQGT